MFHPGGLGEGRARSGEVSGGQAAGPSPPSPLLLLPSLKLVHHQEGW